MKKISVQSYAVRKSLTTNEMKQSYMFIKPLLEV